MTGRTGSSYLVSCLQSHPRSLCEGERLVGLDSAEAQERWIDRFYRRRFRIRAMGFKTKLKDVHDREVLAACLRRHGADVICMRREDVLRQAISVLRARELKSRFGVWNRNVDTPDLGPSRIDLGELDRVIADCLRQREELERYVSELDLPATVVNYEQLLADLPGTMGPILDRLGVRRRTLLASTRKNTDDRLERIIVNYDELRTHLAGTGCERYLG